MKKILIRVLVAVLFFGALHVALGSPLLYFALSDLPEEQRQEALNRFVIPGMIDARPEALQPIGLFFTIAIPVVVALRHLLPTSSGTKSAA